MPWKGTFIRPTVQATKRFQQNATSLLHAHLTVHLNKIKYLTGM